MQTSKSRSLLTPAILTCLMLVPLGCRRDDADTSAEGPAPSSLGQLSHELDRLQGEVQTKNKEISSLLQRYQDQGGKLPENFGSGDLTEEQRNLLAQRFKDERLGMRALLQDILDRDRDIADLKQKIATIESDLPTSVLAQKGDRHDEILMKILKDKGLAEDHAKRLVSQLNLQDPLLPGYRVWTYLKGDVVGTWVTTGEAEASPQDALRRAWNTLTGERDSARKKAAWLKSELATANRDRADLRSQLDTLHGDIGHWSEQVETLRQEARGARQAARYLAGSRKQLRDNGIISGGFLRRTGVKRLEGLETLDLTQSNEIVLRGSEHGLRRIQKVKVLPDGFRRDTDYAVDLLQNGRMARLSLLDVDKFKRSTFVVVLE
jgi:uncharacterized coiled-coil DUF342 family protein